MRFKLPNLPDAVRDDSTGAVLSGATVTIYLEGTTTLATAYADSTTATALTGSQTTTDSYGNFEIWIDGKDYPPDQVFKLTVAKTGYATKTYDHVAIFRQYKTLDLREFLPYGFVTDGSVDYATQIQNALNYANTNNRILEIPEGTFGSTAKLQVIRPAADEIGICIKGWGRGRSIFKYLGTTAIGTLFDLDMTSSYSLNNDISGLKFDVTSAPSGTKGFAINAGIWRSNFEDIRVTRDVVGGVRSGVGIYMGSATPADLGCYDNKFRRLYVAHFSKNLHFQGTDASGNTITNTSIIDGYISDGDYNLYAEWFNGMGAFVTQYESAVTSGAYFANGESYYHYGGSIESAVGGAKGISMDANTKTVVALCDYFNNAGGNFVSNGQIGHFYKTSNSGLIVQPGAEIRFDTDASYTSKARFLKNGVSDVRISADGTSNALNFTDASSTKILQLDVNNKILELVQTGSRVRLTGTAASPTYIQFWENGVRDVHLIPDSGYSISLKNNSTGKKALTVDTTNMVYSFHDGTNVQKITWGTTAPGTGTWIQGDRRFNSGATLGSANGWVCTTGGNPGTWYPMSQVKPLDAVSADKGDAAVTATVGSTEPTIRFNTAISVDRAVTLSTTGAYNGAKFRVVREASATGAFNINVGTGPLKALATASTWCDVEYDGAAWRLTAYGTL